VKDQDVKLPDHSSPPAYDERNLGNFYKVIPVKDYHQMKFIWVLPNVETEFSTSPLMYHSFVLGHEGEGSLLSALIKEGLATGLASHVDHVLSSFTNFYVNVSLTPKGISEYQRVHELVFQMIHKLRDSQK
jgi:insulysin